MKIPPDDNYEPTEEEMEELRKVMEEEDEHNRFEQWLRKNGMTLYKTIKL